MWNNEVAPARQNVQELRQQELQDRYWTSMVKRGSSVEKHDNTAKSARRILQKVADRASPVVLQVQREIVDDKLGWNQTGVGRLANEAILELQVKMGCDIESLNGALEAIRERDRLRRDELERQLEASREIFKDASNREKVQQAKWEEDKKRMMAAVAEREQEEAGELTEQIKKAQKRLQDLTEEQMSQESKWEKERQDVKKKRIPLQDVEEGHVIVAIAQYLVCSLPIFLLLGIFEYTAYMVQILVCSVLIFFCLGICWCIAYIVRFLGYSVPVFLFLGICWYIARCNPEPAKNKTQTLKSLRAEAPQPIPSVCQDTAGNNSGRKKTFLGLFRRTNST